MSQTNAYVRKPVPRLREPGATYFITWRIADAQPPLSHAERTLIADSIRKFAGTRYGLHAWVVMDDHVHVNASPIAPATIDQTIHGWRSFSASRLCRGFARRPPLWQRGGYDRLVWAGGELEQKIAYVVANPWKRWPDCGEYPWVWPLKED
jgi:REP element-mobilizing transposase RayT